MFFLFCRLMIVALYLHRILYENMTKITTAKGF